MVDRSPVKTKQEAKRKPSGISAPPAQPSLLKHTNMAKPKFYNPKKRKPLEKSIEAAIGRYAVSKGCLWWKFVSPNNRSVPDRLVITPNGVAALMEVKREGEKPTPGQYQKMQDVKDRNGLVDWADNVEKGKRLIDEWCALPGPNSGKLEGVW